MSFTIRRAEPGDYEAVRQVYAGPKAIWGTLQSPFSSLEQWRKRMAEPPEGLVSLVACVESEVVGSTELADFSQSAPASSCRANWHGGAR
jgi:L-phenylalanine/L-methionine N-acetyltransferase